MADRTTCNACGKSVAITKARTFYRHWRNTNPMGLGPLEECPMSFKKVHGMTDEERAERQAAYDDENPPLPEMPLP